MHETSAVVRPRMAARVAPALGLFFLAPLTGEYLLGNVPASEIAGVIFLAPMYGGGAILVREAARRAGRGWTAILLLAAAYGVFQPGLLDQALFNSNYDGRYDFTSLAAVPGLGFSAFYAETFVAGHAIWSIGIPIAIMEALVPRRSTTPWLGRTGLVVTGVVFLFGCWIILDDHARSFVAPAPQLIGAGVVTAVLVVAAFAVRRREGPMADRRTPRPWAAGGLMFVLTGAFVARPESVAGAVMGGLLLAAMGVLVVRWSGRQGWTAVHRVAVAGGALLTYMWTGYVLLYLSGVATTANLIGQTVLVVAMLALLFVTVRVARRSVRDQSWRGRPETS
ncbi:hypothetical protein [Sphaerisporangium aureirubrum]|uniref:DUF998 domain-containing protein n=1 Tax=Sphaerisporangium aureirubrum TaxID=1544736 RepID=A0ABW1ND26_9ACTN